MDSWTKVEMMTLPTNWEVVKISGIYPADEFVIPTPQERGIIHYRKSGVEYENEEIQVKGSFSRYNHPCFKELHYKIKSVIEQMMGEKLYPTYYFDRFYFKGQELTRHKDRGACEISVTYNISSNLDYNWPIYFEGSSGKVIDITCNPGDAVLYRGCDLFHWRDPMKGNAKSCFHQAFFHYVRADGYYLQHAYDTR
jgi:hypothetical protein